MAFIALSTREVRIAGEQGPRMVEIACLEVGDGSPTGESFHRYVNPGAEVTEDALKAYGIDPAMVAGKPSFADIAPYFCDFIRGRAVIAFDMNEVALVEREFTKLIERLLPPWKSGYWDLDAQCSLQSLSMLARVVEVPADGLEEIGAYYGVQPPASAAAVDVAKCVGAVYAAMEPDLIAWEREYGKAIVTGNE